MSNTNDWRRKIMPRTRCGLVVGALLALCGMPPLTAQAGAKPVAVAGSLHSIWSEGRSGGSGSKPQLYTLAEGKGKWHQVAIPQQLVTALGGPRALINRHVVVTGASSGAAYSTRGTAGVDTIQAATIQVGGKTFSPRHGQSGTDDGDGDSADGAGGSGGVGAFGRQPQFGSKPFVNILCRFADNASTPQPASFFTALMSNTAPGLDHYWRESSYDNINLTGTAVVGWYTLPQPRSYYMADANTPDFGKIVDDATTAADAEVDFSKFYGVNIMLNGDIGNAAWGGSWTITKDGVNKNLGVTWMPPWGWGNQNVLSHEMGHAFNFDHSSGPYAQTYDSAWDQMSGGSSCPAGSAYGCLGVHTNSYHTDGAGWIPAARKYAAAPFTQKTIDLEELDQPGATGYMMAQIPIPNSTLYYTVEARRPVGYDVGVPGDAVIIHKVNETLSDRQSQVVDVDGNGDTNDAGAMWTVGETWNDAANAISAQVNSITSTGFMVTITNQVPDVTAPTLTISSPIDGSLVTAMPGIFGTAQDNAGGSGLATVTVTLQRASDGLYWTGTSWSLNPTTLPTTITGTNWQLAATVALPAGASFLDGNYTVTVAATDVTNNVAVALATFSADVTAPTIVILNPVTGTASSIATINGTLADNPGGSGVVSLSSSLQRSSDGQYWTGAGWSATPTVLPTTINSDGTWSVSSTVPLPGNLLLDGNYIVVASAADKAGNARTISTTVTIASGLAIIMTAPVTGTSQSIATISGTVGSNPGSSGVASVSATLQRGSDAQYWTGAGWNATPTPLPATINSNGTWAVSSPLPGNLLLDGNYVVVANAADRAGNARTTAAKVTIAAGLAITVTAPLEGTSLNSFGTVQGSVTENALSSGVAGVNLVIQRLADGLYWNGVLWSNQPASIAATVNSDGTWVLNNVASLPTGTSLVDGLYKLTAIASDRAGNTAAAGATITLDVTPPTLTIKTPLEAAIVNKFPVVTGRAYDNPGGTGLNHVSLAIKRYDGVYWNGTVWTEAPFGLPTQLSGQTWSFTAERSPIAHLTDGSYTLIATAYDNAGSATTVSRAMRLDATTPVVPTITTPMDKTFLTHFGAVTGKATDNRGGSGVDHVALVLRRQGDGQFWTGSTWSSSATSLVTTLAGGNWIRRSGFPGGRLLPNGSYTLQATTYDKAGNQTIGALTTITIDTAPPALTFLTPELNASVKALTVARGTVSDNNGSGTQAVALTMQRRGDGKWWNGAAWVAKATTLKAVVSGNVWIVRAGLPNGAQLVGGSYSLMAYATDKLGNLSRVANTIIVDSIAPATLTFTTPFKDAKVSALQTAQGMVSDNPGGSGIDHVELTIQRQGDGHFWNGLRWSASRTALKTQLTGRVWKSNTGLTALNLAPGAYRLTAIAVDHAGNSLSASIAVTSSPRTGLSAAATVPGATSKLALSTATIQVAGASLRLRFTGALEAETAGDATLYSVAINGQSVAVEGAGYDGSSHSVTLSLPAGALHAGDTVSIQWSLVDAGGATLNGGVGPLTAR